MATIVKERYTLNDTTRNRELYKYTIKIVRATKVAKLNKVYY